MRKVYPRKAGSARTDEGGARGKIKRRRVRRRLLGSRVFPFGGIFAAAFRRFAYRRRRASVGRGSCGKNSAAPAFPSSVSEPSFHAPFDAKRSSISEAASHVSSDSEGSSISETTSDVSPDSECPSASELSASPVSPASSPEAPSASSPTAAPAPKGYYEELREKMNDTDWENVEVPPSGENGFSGGERRFGKILCICFIAAVLIIQLTRFSGISTETGN